MKDASDPFLDDDKPLYPGDAVAAILLTPDARYVLQLRDAKRGIFYPGHWGCFGGALDPTDTNIAEGLRRELHEELGIEVPASALAYFTNMTFDLSYGGIGVMARAFYEVQLTDAQLGALRLGEGSAWRGFTMRQALLELKLVPYDAFALWQHANRRRVLPRQSAKEE
jgi:8-oxo-dGTP pyrophosphatase MutT (NUDIX family)